MEPNKRHLIAVALAGCPAQELTSWQATIELSIKPYAPAAMPFVLLNLERMVDLD